MGTGRFGAPLALSGGVGGTVSMCASYTAGTFKHMAGVQEPVGRGGLPLWPLSWG